MPTAERCLQCPLSWDDALVLVGVSLALVLFGRVLLGVPRRPFRAFGMVGLGAALVLHAFGFATIALFGVGGEPRLATRDAAFAAGWAALTVGALLGAARLVRWFPRRTTRPESLRARLRDAG